MGVDALVHWIKEDIQGSVLLLKLFGLCVVGRLMNPLLSIILEGDQYYKIKISSKLCTVLMVTVLKSYCEYKPRGDEWIKL